LREGASIVASYGQDELVIANFTVTSFTMVTIMGSSTSSSGSFSSKQLSDLDKMEGGDNIAFTHIRAVGPDKKVRSLPSVTIQL
jgi:hypothetical protein